MQEIQQIEKAPSVIERTIPKEQKYLGTMLSHPGHTCFQYDTSTGEVTPAVFETTSENLATGKIRKKLLTKQGCLYVTALNKSNAQKKFNKTLAQRS